MDWDERHRRQERERHEAALADFRRRAEQREAERQAWRQSLAGPPDLRSTIAEVLAETDDPDPGNAVSAVLARIPREHRDTVLKAALRVCCYVAADEESEGGSVIPDLWKTGS